MPIIDKSYEKNKIRQRSYVAIFVKIRVNGEIIKQYDYKIVHYKIKN